MKYSMRFAGVLLFALFASLALAQSGNSTISGTVKDASEAAIPERASQDHQRGYRRPGRHRHQFRRTLPRRSAGAGQLPDRGRRRRASTI